MCSAHAGETGRPLKIYSFFSTPLRTFLGVMAPIAAMMLLLACLPRMPLWIRLSAGAVVAVSIHGVYRGYAHRLEIWPEHIRFRSPGRELVIRWSEVRRIDRYTPLDRNRATQYVYVTRLDAPPVDWREIDENTIQLQDRPGLLESLRAHCPHAMPTTVTPNPS